LILEKAKQDKAGLVGKAFSMKRKTNFDQYLEEQLKDVSFAERFKKAGKALASPKIIPITEG
jgi:hypothetical protein